ncbi:uncharacterized protein GGS22DRAFT_188159 [Annulohypoxylon maeteangense]|uniref:uncharacterized protein n=1 Tax=Annulohypoxylon maeteangense TaxID=1927788 RepID=UPI002008101B|nr:uncharacterized protein GGS22DRAFT_188159 [Annulohypoxylon maeteangense]KAI0885870.1 hypothetical protein GGS22DRAFT_188159 [Annulohypoxylon maeteangense]
MADDDDPPVAQVEHQNEVELKEQNWTELYEFLTSGWGDDYDKDKLSELLKLQDKDTINAHREHYDHGRTLLHRAAWNNSTEAAKQLLLLGAEIDVTDDRGYTPLIEAVMYNETETSKFLIDHGANAQITDSDKSTPLYIASTHKNITIMECLLSRDKTSLDVPNTTGRTPLCVAAEEGSVEIVGLLLKLGADLCKADNSGKTPLMFACEMGYLDIVDKLLDNSLNLEHVDQRDNNGMTALYMAFKQPNSSPEIVRLLLDRMVWADFGNQDKLEQEAIIWAAEIEETHDIAGTILMKRKGSKEKPTIAGSESWSAIEWAAYREEPEVLWLLLSSSRPTDSTENSRKLALDRISPQISREIGKGNKGKAIDVNKSLVTDILRDPPFTQTSRRMEPFNIPSIGNLDRDSITVVQGFEAAIIEFYEGNAGSGFLRRFRNVKEAIYDKGPDAILKEAKGNMERIFAAKSKQLPESLNKPFGLYQMYLREKPKFMWVHLPATNMVWMNDLLRRIMKDRGSTKEDFQEISSFFRDNWLQVPDRTSQSRFMSPRCVAIDGKNGTSGYKSLYMPYLTFSTEFSTETDQQEAKLKEAKTRYESLFNSYKGKVIHGSPTLDEAYYHFSSDEKSQDDKRHRNETQVVTKKMYSTRPSSWKLLRVNQLWSWVIDKDLLITATTHPVDKEEDSLLTDILEYLGKRGEAGGSHSQPSSAVDMSKLLVDYCIGFYEREQVDHEPNQSIGQIYFDAINEIAIKEANLYAGFSLQKNNVGNAAEDDVRKKRFAENVKKAISEAAALSCDIKDIRDELNILKTIANYQNNVQMKMSDVQGNDDHSKAGILVKSDYLASRIISDIENMDQAADRIHSAVDTILSLEQNEISNDQAKTANDQAKTANELSKTANRQAEESIKQGRTLMAFTVITTIFLPLSFLSSIFALDYEASQKTPVGVALGILVFIVVFGLQAGRWIVDKLGETILGELIRKHKPDYSAIKAMFGLEPMIEKTENELSGNNSKWNQIRRRIWKPAGGVLDGNSKTLEEGGLVEQGGQTTVDAN